MRPQLGYCVFIAAGWAMRTRLMRLHRKLAEDASNSTYIFAQPRLAYRMERGETREEVAG